MEIDLFKIFSLGVDYGQLTMEEDLFENNWADTMGIISQDKKSSMNSQIIQRQPHGKAWLEAKRKSYSEFIELVVKAKTTNETIFFK